MAVPLQETSTDLQLTLLQLGDDYGALGVVECVKQLWPGLFEQPSSFPARAGDRQTSQLAASKRATVDVGMFKRDSVKAKVLRAFKTMPDTALGAARRASGANTPLSTETARKRVSELVTAGFVRDTGGRRQTEGSPDLATVWQITGFGLAAIEHMMQTGWSK